MELLMASIAECRHVRLVLAAAPLVGPVMGFELFGTVADLAAATCSVLCRRRYGTPMQRPQVLAVWHRPQNQNAKRLLFVEEFSDDCREVLDDASAAVVAVHHFVERAKQVRIVRSDGWFILGEHTGLS